MFHPGGGKTAVPNSGPGGADDGTPPFLPSDKADGAAAAAAGGGGPDKPTEAAADAEAAAAKAADAPAASAPAAAEAPKAGGEGAADTKASPEEPAAPLPPSAGAAAGAASASATGATPAPAKEPTKQDFLATVARKKKKAAAAAAAAAAAKAAKAKAAATPAADGPPGGEGAGAGDGDGSGSGGGGAAAADGAGATKRLVSPAGAANGSAPGHDENFWKWFQQTKGAEHKDASKAVRCPRDDTHRLCETFYKYLRKYKIRTVLDASCGANAAWMPAVLQQVGSELWGFRYYCMHAGAGAEDGAEVAKQALSPFPFVEFVAAEWWHGGFPDGLDLVFCWDVLPHTAYGRVWSFFVLARKHGVKYLLFDNYPGLLNNPSPKRKFINVRKHPFKFPAAKEVVQNVTEPGEHIKRQLLFYETDALPEHLTT